MHLEELLGLFREKFFDRELLPHLGMGGVKPGSFQLDELEGTIESGEDTGALVHVHFISAVGCTVESDHVELVHFDGEEVDKFCRKAEDQKNKIISSFLISFFD
jgi:hypothetical protein